MLKPRKSKYGNIKTIVDGITFDSKKEAQRYRELCLLQRGRIITDLELQVRFNIIVNGIKVCAYVSDFVYKENGAEVVEDVKGKRTAMYQLKKKLMLAVHGIEIKET